MNHHSERDTDVENIPKKSRMESEKGCESNFNMNIAETSDLCNTDTERLSETRLKKSTSDYDCPEHSESNMHSNVCFALQSEDDYEHVVSGLVYAVTSFPGVGITQNVYEDYIEGCECSGVCLDSCCKCSLQYGSPYQDGRLKESHYEKPIFECNDLCKCSDECPNRIVQRGPVMGLKVTRFPEKGLGVVSTNFIPRNSFVCEYAGEYISVEEAHARFLQQKDEDSNYILVLREHIQGAASETQITVIDPTVIGNIGRYINHSCEPNLMVVPVRINGMLPVAALFAVQDILPGNELCYDYGYVLSIDEEKMNSSVNNIKALGSLEPHGYNQQIKTHMLKASLSCETHREIKDITSEGRKHHQSKVKKLTNVPFTGASQVNFDVLSGDPLQCLKPCFCQSKNCRRFLPSDMDVL